MFIIRYRVSVTIMETEEVNTYSLQELIIWEGFMKMIRENDSAYYIIWNEKRDQFLLEKEKLESFIIVLYSLIF